MAKKLVRNYTFNASAKTIAFSGIYTLNQLLLITNSTRNTIIYNFADASLGATRSYDSNIDTTTFTLSYNTEAMSNSDILQIYVDDVFNEIRPDPVLLDPVDKQRVSTPQALIDTDFEYGAQITKWENLGMTNNRPFAFAVPTQIANISSITMPTNSRVVTITLSTGVAPANGTPISVQDTYLSIANGVYIIETGGLTSTFTYSARAINTTGITSILDANKTNVFQGTLYSGANIGVAPTMAFVGTQINVTCSVPHGLSLGNDIAISGSTATTNAPNGSYTVSGISSPTAFSYHAYAIPTGTVSGTTARVFMRPQASFLHRPFDGGVMFSSNAQSNNEQAVRQTRRYFRYQSGKGVQISSGTLLKPELQIDSMTANGTTIRVQTKEQHNIQPGTTVTISGANETAYNGTFVVDSVTGYNTFTYTALSVPSSSTASGLFYVGVINWYGASNKLGLFDQQNGVYFEYDGQKAYIGRRNSTFQISGEVTVTSGSNFVNQTNTSFPTIFSKQLIPGDYVVIRGASYKVLDISSDVSMSISPSYRGTTSPFVLVSKTIDTKISQSAWNLDKCDGTGPSGYNMDLSKMQMFYIDYSWYGAGSIRWGVRATNGNIIYVHKMINNNVNREAYMRSGNLPGRYESTTVAPYTTLTSTLTNVETSMAVTSTEGFPISGTLMIKSASIYEFVNYQGTTSTSFTNLIRARSGSSALPLTVAVGSNTATFAGGFSSSLQVGMRVISASAFPEGTFISNLSGTTMTLSQGATQANPTVVAFAMGQRTPQTFNYSASAPVSVELAYPTYGPSISHWGTSVIMDGRYDDDKSLLFTYGQTRTTTLASGSTAALFSIRVSPSVDSGISAAFGARELINRMQLVLRQLSITSNSNTNLLVRAYLNPTSTTATTWTNAVGNANNVVNSSLAQIADYAGLGSNVIGGEVTAGFFVNGTTSKDLTEVRDLGNSILGGGGATSNTQIYPDGPDVLTITVTNLHSGSVNVLGRLSWTEAQA
jgi:hypothetical protein